MLRNLLEYIKLIIPNLYNSLKNNEEVQVRCSPELISKLIEEKCKYRKIKDNLCNKYEKMYGPLDLTSSSLDKNNWVWNNSPWPWEGDK